MFALLQYFHELHNGLVVTVQLLLAGYQLLLALGEVDELLQGLLVDVAILLELRVTLVQFLPQLQGRGGEGRGGEGREWRSGVREG